MKKLRLISIFLATCIVLLIPSTSAFSAQVNSTNNSTTVSAWSSDESQGSEFTTSFNTTNSHNEYLALKDGTITTQSFEATESPMDIQATKSLLNSSDLAVCTALNKHFTMDEGMMITTEMNMTDMNVQATKISFNEVALQTQEKDFSWNDGLMVAVESKSVMMVPVAVSSYSATTMIGTMVISDAYLDELQFKTQSNGLGEDSATSVSGIDVADGIYTAAALTSSTMNFVGIDVVAMFYEATSASVVVAYSITDNAAGSFALTGYV